MDILFSDALKVQSPSYFHIVVKPAGAACNLNCTYCYYLEKRKLYPGKNNFRMTDKLLKKFIQEFIEANEVPVVTFTWQGGEPTLMGLDFFKKAFSLQNKYSRGRTIENAFQTNGTRLTDEWCKFFKDNNILVGISIDGKEHNHDHYRLTFSGSPTFRKVMKGINLLHKHNVEFNTLSTVNDYNVRFASETYMFLKETGSGFMQFLPVVERASSVSGNGGLKLPWPIISERIRAFVSLMKLAGMLL
jgi:Arylsulfatase regulator (Fe-S oxidoreductase)